MAIDWNDNKKRQAFREALQKVYSSPEELEMFVDEELNENLATIAGGENLQVSVYGLLKWARAKGRLDEVYEAFKRQNPNHSAIAELQQQPLIQKSSNLEEEDWISLFENFSPHDFADVVRAFLRGFRRALNVDFQGVMPDHPPFNEPSQIQKLLLKHDNPQLAVRFVEFVIVEIQRSSEGHNRDLTPLKQWRDRIAQKHNVLLENPEPNNSIMRQGYLLVAIQETGQVTQGNPSVKVSATLCVAGEPNPVEFSAAKVACLLDEVPSYLSSWIKEAEEALIPYQCDQVTLELFLPCAYLEKNVADEWNVQNEQNRLRPLGLHRRLMVRSLERLLEKTTYNNLIQKWKLLADLERTGIAYKQFLEQKHSPKPGTLTALLNKSLGLKLLTELPADYEERQEILYDIINSAVPIALWLSEASDCTSDEILVVFNDLLKDSCLTNFSEIAQKCREKRAEPENKIIRHLRLLCDCPDRYPILPESTRDEDMLVAL